MNHIKWVHIAEFSQVTGITIDAVRGKIKRGIWKSGVIYKKVDNRMMINLVEYEKWILSH